TSDVLVAPARRAGGAGPAGAGPGRSPLARDDIAGLCTSVRVVGGRGDSHLAGADHASAVVGGVALGSGTPVGWRVVAGVGFPGLEVVMAWAGVGLASRGIGRVR